MKIRRLLVIAALYLACQGSAFAQEFSLPPLIDSVGMGNIAIGAAAQAHVEQSRQSQSTAPVNDNTALSYRSDRNRTADNLRNFVDKTADPAAKANLEQIFAAQPNIIQELRVALRSYGLDSHNLGDAYTLWWMNSWLIANKRNDDPNQATIDNVKQQAYAALAAIPEITAASDAQRQEYAEALLLQALLLSASFDQWQGNPALIDQLAQAANQGAQASGMDLGVMALTEQGFVLR